MIKTLCNVCGKELTRNAVNEKWVVESGHFKAEVTVTTDKEGYDLCFPCLLKMLTNPPHRPRSDKGTKQVGKRLKPEPITVMTPELREMEEGLNSEGLTLLNLVGREARRLHSKPDISILKSTEKKGKKTSSKPFGSTQGKPDISTFSVTVGQGDKLHALKLGEVAVSSLTLKEGVKELLGLCGIDREYVEVQEESEGKRQLLDILNPTP